MNKKSMVRRCFIDSKNILLNCIVIFMCFSLLFSSFSTGVDVAPFSNNPPSNPFPRNNVPPLNGTQSSSDDDPQTTPAGNSPSPPSDDDPLPDIEDPPNSPPPNNPPVAIIVEINPKPAEFNETISFIGHGIDTDGEIINWNWRSNINGNLSVNCTYFFSSLSLEISFRYSSLSVGIHTIYFSVQDDDGDWSEEDTTTITVNKLPVADIGEEAYFGWINEPITFDGSNSYDDEGVIDSWEWDFGDGSIGTGEIVEHSYLQSGVYNVTLTVTDNLTGTNTAITTATIVCNPPIANAGGPYFGYANESIIFNGSNSSDDKDILSYAWDFGDGTNGTGECPTHTYEENGTYVVTLIVTDNECGTDSDTTYALIGRSNNCPNKPEVNFRISEEDNATYTFTASSTDPDNDTLRYIFVWGDESNTTTPLFPSGTLTTISHSFKLPGVYTVQIYAEDEHHASSGIVEINITIDEVNTSSFGNVGDESSGGVDEGSDEGNIEINSFLLLFIIFIISTIVAFVYYYKKLTMAGF